MKTIFAALLISTSLFANEEQFLPKNNLNIPVSTVAPTGISEADFNFVIDELDVIYRPLIAAAGGILTVEKLWKSGEVNAYARQFKNNDWRITFMGGMARHKYMTKDGMSLIVCHEIGHHLGGAPRYEGDVAWASNEGQSDYYATAKCLRRLWNDADNAKALEGKTIPAALKAGCESEWSQLADQHLCLRTGLASEAIGNLLASLNRPGSEARRPPKFESPDTRVVTTTVGSHPKPQCRLDTFFQGSLCHVNYQTDFDAKDEVIGSCHPNLNDKIGTRPLCWFVPKN